VLTLVQRAKERLDGASSGLSLVSVEIVDLTPPRQVQDDFTKVQNAFIEMETQIKDAQKLHEEEVPLAEASRDAAVREAQSYAAELLGRARGDADMWKQVYAQYRRNPRVVRQRLWREAIEAYLAQVTRLRFVPPPAGGRYDEFRISIPAGD